MLFQPEDTGLPVTKDGISFFVHSYRRVPFPGITLLLFYKTIK